MTTTHSKGFISGVLAVVCASVLSSIGWIFEGEAVARLSPLLVTCASTLLGGISLVLFGYVGNKKSLEGLRAALSWQFVLYALLRSGLASLLFAYCLTLTSSTKTMFLTKIEPYIVLIIQILFHGHRTRAAHLMLLTVHILGAVILSTGGAFAFSLDTKGDILILIAITINAALYGPTQRYANQMGALYASGASQLVAGVLLLPFLFPITPQSFAFSPDQVVGWGYILASVVVFYILSTALWFFSLKEVPAWLASALRCVGPVIAAPIAWLVFQKPLTSMQTLGAVIVVVTSMWMVVLERRK